MRLLIIRFYLFVFGRPLFAGLNKKLFALSLRGLGILNFENFKISGEENFMHFLIKNYTKGVILDVGSNIGDYAEKLVSVGFKERIYCFEPHPNTFGILKEKFENSNKVITTNSAVSDKSGRMELFDYKSSGTSHASLHEKVITEVHNELSVRHEVEVISLDEFVIDNEIKNVFFLKVDTEGNELNVFNGARKLLSAGVVEIICFEFTQLNLVNKITFGDFYSILSEDYHLYRLLTNGLLEITHYQPLLLELFGFQNIIAIRKDSQCIKNI